MAVAERLVTQHGEEPALPQPVHWVPTGQRDGPSSSELLEVFPQELAGLRLTSARQALSRSSVRSRPSSSSDSTNGKPTVRPVTAGRRRDQTDRFLRVGGRVQGGDATASRSQSPARTRSKTPVRPSRKADSASSKLASSISAACSARRWAWDRFG